MGDRANIVVSDRGQRLFLYSHWQGYELPEILRGALARKQRWDDPAYLTRIIFCEMIKGREASETGFGISPFLQDNEYPLIIVDVDKNLVTFEGVEPGDRHSAQECCSKSFSFADYIALPEASWDTLNQKAAA